MHRIFCLLLLSLLPLSAQSTLVSVIRQPRATLAEFTVPITEFQVRDGGDFAHLHLGIGLGARHWDDGDNAIRFVADANATAKAVFVGIGAIVEVPPGEGAFLGPACAWAGPSTPPGPSVWRASTWSGPSLQDSPSAAAAAWGSRSPRGSDQPSPAA